MIKMMTKCQMYLESCIISKKLNDISVTFHVKANGIAGVITSLHTCSQRSEGPPVLTKKSKPAQVKHWLEDKGFSPM